MGKATVFYAIEMTGGQFVTGSGNTALPTPRLYLTPQSAEAAVKRHWPGIVDRGYTIRRFILDKQWHYDNKQF